MAPLSNEDVPLRHPLSRFRFEGFPLGHFALKRGLSTFRVFATEAFGPFAFRWVRWGEASFMVAAVTGVAALLQWVWAGWSAYSGAGPSLASRWLLTGTAAAALLLPLGAALSGAAVGRRLTHSGLRDQVRVTPWGIGRLALLMVRSALAPPALAALLSMAGWTFVSLVAGGRSGLPGLMAIARSHALVAVIAATFGVWGLALAVGSPRSGRAMKGRQPAACSRAGLWAPGALLAAAAGPALVGPLLPHLSRPERALDAALLLNPLTSVGAALGMDILRSPRVYELTRAPEYWYSYPPAAAVGAVYLALAALGAFRLRQRLEGE